MTLSLLHILVLAFIVSTPYVVTAMASHDLLGEPSSWGNAIRAAAVFSIGIGMLVLAGGYIGLWLKGMIQEETGWIASVLWFVVGLKMILAFRKLPVHQRVVDMSILIPVLLVSLANGLNALLVSVSLGLSNANTSLFAANAAAFVFLFTLLGFFIPAKIPAVERHAAWLYPVSGTLLIIFTLIIF